jgi:hypothetical protein
VALRDMSMDFKVGDYIIKTFDTNPKEFVVGKIRELHMGGVDIDVMRTNKDWIKGKKYVFITIDRKVAHEVDLGITRLLTEKEIIAHLI